MARWGGEIAPASHGQAVVPGDTAAADFPRAAEGIYVGGAGNVALVFEGQTAAIVFTAVPAGTTLHVRARRVNTTNTTATAMVALFTRPSER